MTVPFKRLHSFATLGMIGLFLSITFSFSVVAQSEKSQPLLLSYGDNNFAEHFLNLLREGNTVRSKASLEYIKKNWNEGLIPMALESIWFSNSELVDDGLIELVSQSFKSEYSHDLDAWHFELWNKNIKPDISYANFKASLYREIDPRFETYFRDRQNTAQVRLDEMRWGGVVQDGIPPLRDPKMIPASEANYLDDDNIVFGIEINGDVRAYPKRILAWHEMFVDTIGGVEIAGVYCTLCGTVIPFKTRFNGTQHELGTSGFLYRSNKMMYDQATQSLWSTTRGVPVLGPLVGKGIELEFESVVTTTWGEWRKRHPKTTVLSLNTGHSRDYGEGVAYNEYFSTDNLMFKTPFRDDRLDNKREILALRFAAAPSQQLAIDTEFLNKNPLYKNNIGRQQFVVLTDESGANRVYDPKAVKLASYDGSQTATDETGEKWEVNESWLVSASGERLPRLPYHRAFWFGWRAAFPETQLIK